MTQRKKPSSVLANQSFTFAFGKENGQVLKKMIVRGIQRHSMRSIGEYIKHCIRETSLREAPKKSRRRN